MIATNEETQYGTAGDVKRFPYQQIKLKMTKLEKEKEIHLIGMTLPILLMQLNTVKLYNDSSRLNKGASVRWPSTLFSPSPLV